MPTLAQHKQQQLSWKLRMVYGATGTLYPRESELPENIKRGLRKVVSQLEAIGEQIKLELSNLKP
jgi:hypothetical protein